MKYIVDSAFETNILVRFVATFEMQASMCTLLYRTPVFENNVCCAFSRLFRHSFHKYSYKEIKNRRNELFTAEMKSQRGGIGRVEKIEVNYIGVPENVTLSMNRNISTPYNCAQHISEMLVQRSALALLDDVTLWDMHRPLEGSCSLRLLHFKDHDPFYVNKAFWRTCSIILGAVATECFKENISVTLCSFPSPNVRSGSFVYDVQLDLDQWKPSVDELRVLSAEMVDFCRKGFDIERLCVNTDIALEMFEDNPYKSQQIPDIASNSETGNSVVLYRVGKHIDISRGPLVANTNFIGRCSIVAVHQLENKDKPMYRFQGVALPHCLMLNHFAYGILENRAKIINQDHYKPVSRTT